MYNSFIFYFFFFFDRYSTRMVDPFIPEICESRESSLSRYCELHINRCMINLVTFFLIDRAGENNSRGKCVGIFSREQIYIVVV